MKLIKCRKNRKREQREQREKNQEPTTEKQQIAASGYRRPRNDKLKTHNRELRTGKESRIKNRQLKNSRLPRLAIAILAMTT